MMFEIPRCISKAWLDKRKMVLKITARTTNDGSPNPAHAELDNEIREAEAELNRWNEFAGWVKTAHDMTPNLYPLRAGSQTFEPMKVFVKKDKVTGKTTFMTFEKAWEEYLAKHQA